MRVLVTRPKPEASRTAARLEAAGHEPVVVPLTETIPLVVPSLSEIFDAVAVTSANALRHAPPALLESLAARRCFAVGGATAQAARAAGFADIASGPGDAASLARMIAAALPYGATVLYLCGRVRMPGFEATLAEASINCRPLETYDTVAVKIDASMAATPIGQIDAVLLYSAHAAQAFVTLFDALPTETFSPTFRAVCMSPRVGSALPDSLRRRTLVAERPEEEAMLELLAARQSSV